MAPRKCRNIYFPKYFMDFSKFTNIYHIPKYFCTSVNFNGRSLSIHYSSFALYMPLLHKKGYGSTDRGKIT